MNGQDIREQFGVNHWLERNRVITSLDLAKRADVLPGLRQVRWDLVIVDEAHRMSGADEGTRGTSGHHPPHDQPAAGGARRAGLLLALHCDQLQRQAGNSRRPSAAPRAPPGTG